MTLDLEELRILKERMIEDIKNADLNDLRFSMQESKDFICRTFTLTTKKEVQDESSDS